MHVFEQVNLNRAWYNRLLEGRQVIASSWMPWHTSWRIVQGKNNYWMVAISMHWRRFVIGQGAGNRHRRIAFI